ncbi:MAG: archaetidylserine decarboxylase [Pseudomonadota bacterium]
MPSPFVLSQHIAPQHLISKVAGGFAASTTPWIRNALIRRFVKAFDVDLSEAARTVEQFESFNDFFTRELREGARPIADHTGFIACPADGAVSQIGAIRDGQVFQAKGREYSVTALLGGDAEQAQKYENGSFATIYLSPRDYHRVHMPAGGALQSTAYVPGDLFSVNQETAEGVDALFARNERLVCHFKGSIGPYASVMVGAMIVAGIDTVWPNRFSTHARAIVKEDFASDSVTLSAGDEMGRFYLGSTVILLFASGGVEWLGDLEAGTPVRMGQPIARRLSAYSDAT